MSIGKLIDFFSTFRVLPVEIQTISDQIVESYKVADEILFVPVVVDPAELKGLHYRYFGRDDDGNVVNRILIIFSDRLSIEEQRIVCCKELIHILDEHYLQTDTKEKVLSLAEALTGPLPKHAAGISDIASIKDRLAIYQALSVLIPEEMREELLEIYGGGSFSAAALADMFLIPQEYIDIVMRPNWSKVWLMLKDL